MICKAAAQQVASTARSHPQQLPNLLQKVPSHDYPPWIYSTPFMLIQLVCMHQSLSLLQGWLSGTLGGD